MSEMSVDMIAIFNFLRIIAILQLIIVCGLLLFAYAIKIYAFYSTAYRARINAKIEGLLKKCLVLGTDFDVRLIKPYRRQVVLFIEIINRFDGSIIAKKERATWQKIRNIIVENILLPRARVFATSKDWTARYRACQIFQLGLMSQDESKLALLIHDPISLISISAAVLAIKLCSQHLVDAVIDAYSDRRRVQQSFYVEIVAKASAELIPLIANRITREKNPYVKAFCYRMLAALTVKGKLIKTAQVDILSETVNLKLATLDYWHHTEPNKSGKLLVSLLQDKQWEMRARAAKLLGEQSDKSAAHALEKSLRDPVWWVRINAATALVNLGKVGLTILKNQDVSEDQYAYDAAVFVLSSLSKDVKC